MVCPFLSPYPYVTQHTLPRPIIIGMDAKEGATLTHTLTSTCSASLGASHAHWRVHTQTDGHTSRTDNTITPPPPSSSVPHTDVIIMSTRYYVKTESPFTYVCTYVFDHVGIWRQILRLLFMCGAGAHELGVMGAFAQAYGVVSG